MPGTLFIVDKIEIYKELIQQKVAMSSRLFDFALFIQVQWNQTENNFHEFSAHLALHWLGHIFMYALGACFACDLCVQPIGIVKHMFPLANQANRKRVARA